MKDEKVIQAFSSHAPQKTLTPSIRLRGSTRRSKHLDATGGCHACKTRPEFLVIIPDKVFWSLPVRSRFPQLLRHSEICRRSCHVHMDHLSRFQFDNEEGKKRTEEEVRDLQEITGLHLCRMITQEGFPALSTGSFGANLLHILLDGSFTHPNIQFEELAPNAFCPPESIVGGHLPDQGDDLV